MLAWRSWESYLVVFGASVCTLVLEIVAGRVLAPAIGVSLYTWTTVIGTVLAGVAVGNFAGGLAARRAASPAALACVLLAAALAAWVTASLARSIDLPVALADLSPIPRLLALVGGFFFLPSALLGAVTPLVAQLTLRERAEAGAVVGRLGAVSAVGSIAGTFATGFALIPAFGSRAILMGVAVALLALAALVAVGRVRLGRGRAVAAVVGAALVLGGTSCALALNRTPCARETAYYCIRLSEGSSAQTRYVTLIHDRTIQGFTAPDAPGLLVADYTQAFADVAALRLKQTGQTSLHALFIGGGSFTLPRYLPAAFPGSRSDVLEVDPGVTANARERLGLHEPEIDVRHVDARLGVREIPLETYDLVYGDAFSDISVPWHLTTAEFDLAVRQALKPTGMYAVNLIDSWETGRFLPAFVKTMAKVFPHVLVLRVRDVQPGVLSNWVVVGAEEVIDPSEIELLTRPGLSGPQPSRGRAMPRADVERMIARSDVPLLTDDYAPVDWLLSGRYLD
jgi:spermidine synthase